MNITTTTMNNTTPTPAATPRATPRTDALVTGNSDPTQGEYEDLAYFARTLERESAAQSELIAEMERALQWYYDKHDAGVGLYDDYDDSVESLGRTRTLLHRAREAKKGGV